VFAPPCPRRSLSNRFPPLGAQLLGTGWPTLLTAEFPQGNGSRVLLMRRLFSGFFFGKLIGSTLVLHLIHYGAGELVQIGWVFLLDRLGMVVVCHNPQHFAAPQAE